MPFIQKKIALRSILTAIFTSCCCYADGILNPKGIIATDERKLLFDAISLMLIIVIPVISMSFVFAYRFRSTKRRGEYKPDWHDDILLETFWWAIPGLIILILSILVWKKTHSLDPYQEIKVEAEKETIEVVALSWKWLFLYPKEGVATINDLHIPVNKQVEFHITADAPMSSFAIPQLVGQIYAMAGMRTRLHMYTENIGVYEGLNTQLNGEGYSQMHFKTHVVSNDDFNIWVYKNKLSNKPLTLSKYAGLYKPSIAAPPVYFSSYPNNLFMDIIKQYNKKNSWLH